MEPYVIPDETHDFTMHLFREKGIKFLYDLSLVVEWILKKEIEEYTHEEQQLPFALPNVIHDDLDIEINTPNKNSEEHKYFYRKYSGYEEVRSRRDQVQSLKQEKIDKEISNNINKLTYGELITLAFNKSEKNLGLDLLGFIYFQVKELANKHKVHLNPDDTCYIHVDGTGLAKTRDVINQAIAMHSRISTLGILEYILDKAIKEIEAENEARYLFESRDDWNIPE